MSHERMSDTELEERLRGHYAYDRVTERKSPPEKRLSFDEIALGYDERGVYAEAQRCLQCQDPPCVEACPAHLNVPGYAKAIVEGNYAEGLQIIMDTYPLPGTCGRVCFHPCTDVCLRGVRGEPVNIPRLRRFLADNVSQYDLNYRIAPSTGKRIACVGSGPSSLACAYHLLRRGHEVVVFEKEEKPGGALNTIPDYRLPDRVLQGEIQVLQWLGVDLRTGTPVGGEGCLDELLEEFDAVYVGAGAIGSWKPRVPGKDLPGCLTGLEYLRAVDRGEMPPFQRVAVIGGGDVAMDALRTAMRTADHAYWVYRRSSEQMPGNRDEVIELGEEAVSRDLTAVEEALLHPFKEEVLQRARAELLQLTFEERQRLEAEFGRAVKSRVLEQIGGEVGESGGHLAVQLLTNPAQILGEGHVEAMELQRMELGEPDESGRRKPIPVEGSEFVINVDAVIFAIGQEVESGWLGEESGVELKKWGEVIVNGETRETSRPRVYAGGDAVRGPSSMIDALADGIRAADSIHGLLVDGADATAHDGRPGMTDQEVQP